MKKLNAIRDELTKDYCVNDSFVLINECGSDRDRRHFSSGFDAGVLEMQKIVEPLIEALSLIQAAYATHGERMAHQDVALKALQKYKEAIE